MDDENAILTSEKVNRVFMDCIIQDDEPTPEQLSAAVRVEGISLRVWFDSVRLEEHRSRIEELLGELEPRYEKGYSFLEACNDKNGRQWADLHWSMDQLFMLGMAIQKVEECLPRGQWYMLPGGMPYYRVLVTKEKQDAEI